MKKNGNSNEDAPLVASNTAQDMVIPTSTGGTTPELTVHALFQSSDATEIDMAMTFLRRVFALLVFQYSTVLVVASPFALIEPFKDAVHPHYHALLLTAMSCMVASIVLAITKGALYPYSGIVIVTLTLSVAVELGLTFSEKSWGDFGLIAVGQATASFCIMLAFFQFDTKSLKWLTFPVASIICFGLAGIWSVVLHESGLEWWVACAISLGGWVFCMLNLSQCLNLCKLVAPEEYVFATLFILFPQAILCLSSSKTRRVTVDTASTTAYGGVGSNVV